MTKEERGVRAYAAHMALIVRGVPGAYTLSERRYRKRLIGKYKTIPGLEQAISRFGEQVLRDAERGIDTYTGRPHPH
jgi:hypothetical protein